MGDLGSIPGSGRSPGGGMVTHSSILAWTIPWTEEPGGPRGGKESDPTERLGDMIRVCVSVLLSQSVPSLPSPTVSTGPFSTR